MASSTSELLEDAAKRGDEPADRLIDTLARSVDPQSVLQFLQNTVRLATRTHLDHELAALGVDPRVQRAIETFLATEARAPAWIRPSLVAKGAELFRQHVSTASLALGAASLPTCYCWSQEAAVLMHTGRLAREAPRRVLETAQFALDAMSPDGLRLDGQPHALGVRSVQKVRLLHAVLRYMLRNRQALYEVALRKYSVTSGAQLLAAVAANPWLAHLVPLESEDAAVTDGSVPINQEQLAGTLLTFSLVILRAFERLRIRVSSEQAEAYLHAWNVVGYLLGVEERLLANTGNLQDAQALLDAIMQRHRRPSEHARILTAALSGYLAQDIELVFGLHRWLPAQRIPRLTMRMLLQPETLDAVGVEFDLTDRWLSAPFNLVMMGLGRLRNVPWFGGLSAMLFGYLAKKVWGWRDVPFASEREASGSAGRIPPNRIMNWSGTVETRPARVACPSSVTEVAQVLTDSAQFPSPVRVVGSFHSTTPCASADGGTVIRLESMNRILEIGPDFVEVEAGALYIDVAHELDRRGLEFFVNLQIGNITMGAAACSTTKDGAFPGEFAQASSYCMAMTIVSPDGVARTIDDSTPELMQAARSSHGLIGVVCVTRFRIRPIQTISIEHRNLSVDEFLDALPALAAGAGSLEYYLYPFIDGVTVQIRRPSTGSGAINHSVWRLRNFGVTRVVPAGARVIGSLPTHLLRDAVSALFYQVARLSLRWLCRSPRTLASDQTTRYLQPPGPYGFTFALWGFPEKEFPQILRDYIALTKRHYADTGYRSHMLTVGYRVSQDANALLSYSRSGTVITIDPTGLGGAGWDRFLDAYNDFCCERGGIPLLNQTPRLSSEQVRRSFGERLRRFEHMRRQADPANRLLNPYFASLLEPADKV